MPATTPLEKEAYENATVREVEGVRVRVVLPEHLVAIMLKVGRLKDLARVEMFLSQGAVDPDMLNDILERHALTEKLAEFDRRVS